MKNKKMLVLLIILFGMALLAGCGNTQILDNDSKLTYSDLDILDKSYENLTQDEKTRLIIMQNDMTVDEMNNNKSNLKRLYVEEMADAYGSEETANEMFEKNFEYEIRKKNGQLTAEEMEKEKARELEAEEFINKVINENPQEEKDNWIEAGMYKVGSDINAGEYFITTDGSPGYFQVTKDSSGTLESILSNDNFLGNRYVTVQDGQYLQFSSVKAIPIDEAPSIELLDGKYPEGMYKVGKDIEPGEYKIVADLMAYVEVSKNSNGMLESIISNDNFEGEKYITVKDGQYLKVNSGYIIAK